MKQAHAHATKMVLRRDPAFRAPIPTVLTLKMKEPGIFGERERANLVVQLARFLYIAVSVCPTHAESRKDYDVNFTYTLRIQG